jgi:hypothetical protein
MTGRSFVGKPPMVGCTIFPFLVRITITKSADATFMTGLSLPFHKSFFNVILCFLIGDRVLSKETAHRDAFGVDVRLRNTGFAAQRVGDSRSRERQMSDEKESLIGRRVRFRAHFYTTRIMPPRDWTGTIEDERRSSSGQGVTSYLVLLDEPFRLQEQDPRVDATEDEMEPF